MKTKLITGAMVLLAAGFAAQLSAQKPGSAHIPNRTTLQSLAERAAHIVVGQLVRVDDVALDEVGSDALVFPRIHEGKVQDGEEYVRRDAVLEVLDVIKGGAVVGSELSFVSMRQLRLEAYDPLLRDGPAMYFLWPRESDGLLAAMSDERGTVGGAVLPTAVAYVRSHLENGASVQRLLNHIDYSGSRVSVDSALELSWNFLVYEEVITDTQREQVAQLAKNSPVGSVERNELITAVGRYQPETGFSTLFDMLLSDSNWSTTSLACYALNNMNRAATIERLLEEWNEAETKQQRMVIVRSLGLINPKTSFDGAARREASLSIVRGLLNPATEHDLLREALVASRDMRAEKAHMDVLKALINGRHTNGLGEEEVKGAIVALAAARTMVMKEGMVHQLVHSREYLENLAESTPAMAQFIESALAFPWTTFILCADGRMR